MSHLIESSLHLMPTGFTNYDCQGPPQLVVLVRSQKNVSNRWVASGQSSCLGQLPDRCLRTITKDTKLGAPRRLSQKFNHAHLGIKKIIFIMSLKCKGAGVNICLIETNINIKNDHQNNGEICFCMMLTMSCYPVFSRLMNPKIISGLYNYYLSTMPTKLCFF